MIDFQKIRNKQKWLFGIIAIPVIIGFVILFTPDAEDRLFGQGRQSESGSYGQLNGKVVTRAQWMEAQNIVIGQVGEYASRLGDEFLDNRTVQVLREKALMAHYGIHPSQALTLMHHAEFVMGVPYKYRVTMGSWRGPP